MKGKEARLAEFKRVTNEQLFAIQQQARVYQEQIASLKKMRRPIQAPTELARPKADPTTRIAWGEV
jgi:hypothetical protein